MKIKSNWYSYEKQPYDYMRQGGLLPEGKLFSKAQYPTNITGGDLPESYIYGRFYKRWGYLNSAGVVDMRYKPNKFTNHMWKDDCLIISYTGQLGKEEKDYHFENEDFRIWGPEIIEILKGIRDYSGLDISGIIIQIKDKQKWLNSEYPDYKYDTNIDELFEKPIYRYDSFSNK